MRNRGECVSVVDFGSREIRVLIARKDMDGAIQVIGHGTEPARGCISQGVIQKLATAQFAFKRALAAAEKEAQFRVSSLFCAVNGKNIKTYIRDGKAQLPAGIVQTDNMTEALEMASNDILQPGARITPSITSQEWYVDDLPVMDPVGIRGQVLKVRVHFALIPAVIEDNLISCIESQRCELEEFVFAPLAAAQGCLTAEDMELGVAVIDMGHTTTGLALYRDYSILDSHCFERAGYHVTRDMAAGLQIAFDEADELILTYGVSEERIRAASQNEEAAQDAENEVGIPVKLRTVVPGASDTVDRRYLEMIIYQRTKELLTRVRQHLSSRGLTKHLIRGVVLTGGTSTLKNYIALAESIFRVPCRKGIPDTVANLPQAVCSPEYSVAVGLVRYGFEYRAAVRNGLINTPFRAFVRRLGKTVRHYFF